MLHHVNVLDLMSNLPIEIDSIILDSHHKFHSSHHTPLQKHAHIASICLLDPMPVGSLCSPFSELNWQIVQTLSFLFFIYLFILAAT